MNYDLIIKNGDVVLRNGIVKCDIGIKNGKIVSLASNLSDEGIESIEATDYIVMPGMVDAHVHINEPGRTDWESFITGTKALAAGGTTTYINMPLNSLPATVCQKSLNLKEKIALNKNYIDYGFYGGLVPDNLDQLDELIEGGVLAFKCFLATTGSDIEGDFKNINDFQLYKGMKKLAEKGGLLCIHAENSWLTDELAREKVNSKSTSIKDYTESRPIFTEVEAVKRALYFSEITNCRVHFVHISSAEAVDEIIKAKQEGVDVTVESCPHYFALNEDDFIEIGTKAKCSPPLRTKGDQEKLWDKLLKGDIDTLASDHSPCLPSMKEGHIFEAWGGISGCQNNIDIMFDLAVKQRNLPIEKFADLVARNPAERFGLTNKGEIALNKDADIILIDPNSSYIVKKENLFYKNKFSAYEGMLINCQVTKTILRGQVVYSSTEGITGNPIGKLIKAN